MICRRYLGPTEPVTGEPVNLAMADRWRRKLMRQQRLRDRRAARPLALRILDARPWTEGDIAWLRLFWQCTSTAIAQSFRLPAAMLQPADDNVQAALRAHRAVRNLTANA